MKFIAMDTQTAKGFRAGKPDANGNTPERMISDGGGYPCRHCLCDVPAGKQMLLVAWRPFSSSHSYAETGPAFICAENCERYEGERLPPVLAVRPAVLVRGYDSNERIVDGTGGQVSVTDLTACLEALLAQEGIASVHLRSAVNSCFTCKVVA